jgi:hypothetical protein
MIGHMIVDGGTQESDGHGHTRNDTDNAPLATCRGKPRWMKGMLQIKTAQADRPL